MITVAGTPATTAVKDFVTVVSVDGTRAALQQQQPQHHQQQPQHHQQQPQHQQQHQHKHQQQHQHQPQHPQQHHQQQHQSQHQQPHAAEDSFVTVLSIGGETTPAAADTPPADAAEEVLVYRLPGERLGFGLRFDGVDTCNRLFVQSCADGSPASRTHASWGPLSAGDEIVRINGRPVNRLSRDDCVRCLKESGLVVKLHMVDGRARAPPPVPPRKQKRPEPPPPVAVASSAAVYTDAVERFVYHGESESDDTNSSVSTVVSKCPAAPFAGDDECAADAKNCVLDRVLEPFMQLEREFSSSAAIGDDVGLYEKLVAVAEEDRLPPKPLPRKEVRPPKKKPPPPPPPLPSAQPQPQPPPPPPPAYRLPPRLVDFVHKDEPPQATAAADAAVVDTAATGGDADDDADDDDVFANTDTISCPSADENVINTMHEDRSPVEEDRERSCNNRTADLTSSREQDRSCGGGGGGSRDDDGGGSPIMKSSYSQAAAAAVDSGRTDSETDSDGPKYGVSATRRPTGRTDEVCSRSVRDKIAMFSRATVTATGEKKDSSSSSSSSSSAYSTGSPDSSPAASPKPAYYSTLPRKPPAQQYCPAVAAAAQQQQRRPASASSCPQQSDHRRSQSLVEQPYSKYFNTMNAYAEMGRSSLNALIEQRRRSMSKLRGLVIPEKVPGCGGVGAAAAVEGDAVDDGRQRLGGAAAHQAVVIADLPLVIKSLPRSDYDDDDDDDDDCGGGPGPAAPAVLCPPTKTYVNGPPPVMGTVTRYASPVKTVARQPAAVVPPPPVVCGAVAIASPAEQRRPSAAAAPDQRRPSSASSSPSSSSSASSSSSSSSSSLNSSREELRHIHDERPPSDRSKGSFKADSDEDSALSSSRSSTSLQQYSPASSPPPPPVPSSQPPALPKVAAAPSACSDVGKRVLKAESVEAINRKNVLCSARISSGKPEAPPQQPPLSGNHVKTEHYHHHHHHQPQQQAQQQADGGAAAAAAVPAVKSSTAKTAAFAVNGTGNGGTRYTHNRMSSMESTTSDDSSMQYAVNAEPFGSISSLASSTSLISQQELQQLIDDANQTLEENGCGATATAALPVSVEVMVVILHRDMATSSVGITLAGGADYETKEITVYKVLTGSPADKDGRIRKGDRILSINGKSMKGLTHRESLAILKAPRSEVVLVISRCKSDTTVESSVGLPHSIDLMTSTKNDVTANRVFGPLTKVILSKDGSGLGFSLDGGKNSPTGDQPLTVKKIFTGGCAEQCGQILAGDELVSVNDIDVTGMSRTEAWNLMKRLVNGTVTLCIRHVV